MRGRQSSKYRALSDRPGEVVGEIGLHGGFVAGGAQETQPGLLLVPDGAEFPDAVGALVAASAREEGEAGRGGVLLVVDGFPDLIRAAPGADDQEVEIVLAAMQDHEADVAVEPQTTGLRFR